MDSGYPSGFDVACGRHSYVLLVWTRMSALLWLDAGMVRGHSKREELQALNEIPDLSRTKFRESYTLELSLWFQNTWMDWSEWPWDTLTMHLLSFRTVAKGYLLTPGNCPPPKKNPLGSCLVDHTGLGRKVQDSANHSCGLWRAGWVHWGF